MQGRFYNKLYIMQALLSSAFVLSTVFTEEYNWSEDMASGLRVFFSIWQARTGLVVREHEFAASRMGSWDGQPAGNRSHLWCEQVPGYALKEFLQYIVFGIATAWLAAILTCMVSAHAQQSDPKRQTHHA